MSDRTASSAAAGEISPTDYERIGGAAAVTMVVNRFYYLVLADPELAPFFDDVDVARVKRHQVLLISQILGGPVEYGGPDLRSAHSGMDIADGHFDRVATHLVSVLSDAGVPEDIIGRVRSTLVAVEPDIVSVPTG